MQPDSLDIIHCLLDFIHTFTVSPMQHVTPPSKRNGTFDLIFTSILSGISNIELGLLSGNIYSSFPHKYNWSRKSYPHTNEDHLAPNIRSANWGNFFFEYDHKRAIDSLCSKLFDRLTLIAKTKSIVRHVCSSPVNLIQSQCSKL